MSEQTLRSPCTECLRVVCSIAASQVLAWALLQTA